MIDADTNVLSTFARVGAIDLLRQLRKSDRLHVTPATFNELRRAVDVGCEFLGPTLEAIQIGTGLDLVELRREEVLALNDLPRSLGAGEAESIAVCLRRAGKRLLTEQGRDLRLIRRSAQSAPIFVSTGALPKVPTTLAPHPVSSRFPRVPGNSKVEQSTASRMLGSRSRTLTAVALTAAPA